MKQEGAVGLGALRGLSEVAPETARTTIVEWLKGENPAKRAAAIGVMRQSRDPNASKVLIDAFPSLPGESKVMVVDVLGSKGDAAAKPMIVKLVGENDEALRVVAIRALGSLGDASDVPMLAEQAANGQGGAKDAARQSLARLKGKDVDGAIVKAAEAGAPEVRVELIKSLAARAASSANDKLLAIAASDQNEQVRAAALASLGQLVSGNEYPKLVDLLAKPKADADRDAARKAVGDAATRMENRNEAAGPVVVAMDGASKETKAALIGTLTRIGGDRALAAVRAVRKDADPAVAEAAARSLTEWQDGSAIDDMLDIAKTGNERQKVLALQGLNRVLSQPNVGKSAQEKLAIYRQMMDASPRTQEKKLVIAGLGDMKDPAAFAALVPLVSDEALKNEAANAVVKVAKAVWDNAKPAAKAALEKVITANVDDGIKKQAQEQLGK
jgi:HEAT repeat protein